MRRKDNPYAPGAGRKPVALVGGKIDEDVLTECAKCFPKRTLQNLKRSEVYHVLAQ